MSQQLRRVAIVTGAAQGIGFGIAKKLVVNGIDVALIDYDQAKLSAAVDQLKGFGGKVIGVSGNVCNIDEVQSAIKQVIAWGGQIDYLVNNAGIIRDKRLLNMTEAD